MSTEMNKAMGITLSMIATVRSGKPEDKEKVPQIIREHQEWLADRAKGRRADLREMCLEGMELSGVDLSYADLSGAWLEKAKLVGTKLTGANLDRADLGCANLTEANLDDAQLSHARITHACLEGASLRRAVIRNAALWDSNFKRTNLEGAILSSSQLCDCSFESANLDCAYLDLTDLDYASFKDASLKYILFDDSVNAYYANFKNADLTGVDFADCPLDEKRMEGAVGFHPHMRCPEEGSFIAWKKCRDDRIVKLMIPETAARTGASAYSCRASEALVLDIWDRDNEPCGEAVSGRDESFVYRKGETVLPAEDYNDYLLDDGSGIHFFLTRSEAEQYELSVEDGEKDD